MSMGTNGQRPHDGAKKRNNKLSRPEIFKAARWIEDNWQRFEKMTRLQAANELSAYLLRDISHTALNTMIRDMGKKWPGRTQGPRDLKHLAAGHARALLFSDQILKLSAAVDWLASQYGATVPDRFRVDQEQLRSVADRAKSIIEGMQ